MTLRLATVLLALAASVAGCGRPAPAKRPQAKITSAQDGNLALGNPSGAGADINNFLVQSSAYSLSYNSSKCIPNWVSWHLSAAWNGYIERCDCFHPDDALPPGAALAAPEQYYRSGYDRGHLCPADDRDLDGHINAATFAMSNIAPQVPQLNRDVWEKLEAWCRQMVAEGKELYIIAGTYGEKGRISGHISVPAYFWKAVLILEEGKDDLQRITPGTRVVAVNMPNQASVNAYPWSHYRTTIDEIERLTGYDLLSALPRDLQSALESRIDLGPAR